MKPKRSLRLDAILSVLLLVATVITILLEIFLSGSTTTRLEISLFSILQFLFSLSFTWVIARMSLREEFQQSQRKFAISAYRRIIEIRNGADRLIARATAQTGDTSTPERHGLDIVTEIGIGIRETIRSSISDWADIIGDEIEAVEKIQIIREQQAQKERVDELDAGATDESQEESNAAIEKLLSELPLPLRVAALEKSDSFMNRVKKARSMLKREKAKTGHIEVKGFSEKDAVDSDIYSYTEGDILHVKTGDDNKTRIGALIAYNDAGQSVGIIVNMFPELSYDYQDAAGLLFECLGRSQFSIQLLRIDRETGEHQRHYFTGKVLDRHKVKTSNSD